jgi:hypothetical protein
LLSDVAKVVFWSAIAEGEGAKILCVCPDRWEATQVREQLFADYHCTEGGECMWGFLCSGAVIHIYFSRSRAIPDGAYSHILIFSDLVSERSPGGILHRLLQSAESEGSGTVVVRC